MNTPNPALQQLKDIHLPRAVSMWPTAPGWIMLYFILLIFTAYCLYKWLQRNKRLRAIRYARQRLMQLRALCTNNTDNINIAVELSTLIRRTALYYFPRESIAGLSGTAWLEFLNRSGKTNQFTDTSGRLLIDAPYRKQNNADIAPLFALTEKWLNTIAKLNEKERQ